MEKTMKKKSARKSASKWEEASERELIKIWGQKMSKLLACRKNLHVIMEMVEELKNKGYVHSVVELKTKMHNLSARYRKEKRKVGATGGSPSEWDLYAEMQALLTPNKSYHSEGLVLDSINNMNSYILPDESHSVITSPLPSPSKQESSPLPSPSATSFSPFLFVTTPLSSPGRSEDSAPSSSAAGRTKDLAMYFNRFEKNIDKIRKDIKTTSEKFISIEMEKKDILKSYVEKEAEVQKELIKFLKRQ